jgi:hypothetical protein
MQLAATKNRTNVRFLLTAAACSARRSSACSARSASPRGSEARIDDARD